ncbi:hypothetical protein [Bradyrhizobium diazoefficiens]|uniref:hypothetical protein n=1 Tax=Bradyrhizobium diazoefficiens TaxID=1355477 RepID=UPI0027155566|nr:hypothetical protein [Bradyrhizobium diazoefficiens]WLB42298.1 hypothetical protein QIH78_21650 [Bradyrhizobium diazoefficiens]
MPANDNARPQVHLRLTAAEARQLDDARTSLRLSRSDLIRLALDDLFRGPRLKPQEHLITRRKPFTTIAA